MVNIDEGRVSSIKKEIESQKICATLAAKRRFSIK
jgi:hypothetical protein